MKIHNESIGHFIHWMKNCRHFSLAGFSDAEWYCILKVRLGERTGFGQTLDGAHGELLADVVRRRAGDKRFLFAVPRVLWTLPEMAEGQIDWWLGNNGIKIEGYERDMITDDLAREARLTSLIKQLNRMRNLVLIGNEALVGMSKYLKIRHFIGISSPNLHLEPGGIDRAVQAALKLGRQGTYLVSAGVSAAVIIDRLHDRLPGSWLLDCGSIWDAFVGIGGQRQWRAELYADAEKWRAWIAKNTAGT